MKNVMGKGRDLTLTGITKANSKPIWPAPGLQDLYIHIYIIHCTDVLLWTCW